MRRVKDRDTRAMWHMWLKWLRYSSSGVKVRQLIPKVHKKHCYSIAAPITLCLECWIWGQLIQNFENMAEIKEI